MVAAIVTNVSGGTQALHQEPARELPKRPKIQGANLDVGLARPAVAGTSDLDAGRPSAGPPSGGDQHSPADGCH